jgi:5-methylcytosine-specific restriction endonuclease McrA
METKERFFEELFINSTVKKVLFELLKIDETAYTEWLHELENTRKDEIAEIKRIRSLFHSKKNSEGFDFKSFLEFYKWHKKQYEAQKGHCYYCGTHESVTAAVMEKKYPNRKRFNRGMKLEVERKDSIDNKYTAENCVLACYFCNNDKSEFFTEEEYRSYLANRKGFFENEYAKITL